MPKAVKKAVAKKTPVKKTPKKIAKTPKKKAGGKDQTYFPLKNGVGKMPAFGLGCW